MDQINDNPKIQLLFDGNCIVCDIEISKYKRMWPEKFELVDISDPGFNPSLFDLTKEAVDFKFHAVKEGHLLVGVDAFICIWTELGHKYPGFKYWAKIAQILPIKVLLSLGYEVFIRIRPVLPKRSFLRKLGLLR